MTETPARLLLDPDDLGRCVRTVLPDEEPGPDVMDGQRGWCEDALAGMPFPCSPELWKQLDRLHAVNSRQWGAEDRVRRAGDAEIPAIKRKIDELNSLRHKLIEQVDRLLGTAWPVNHDVPPLTESIGSALDRLSVLTLRIVHTERLVGDDNSAVERVAILRRQRDDLVWSIAVACEDLVSGRRRTPRPERMKLYGKPGGR
ncbi:MULTISPECIES: DUF4254 domain-containing protein [Streptomyces]|uniref:DUF4254 domain-containing protein n=1 Tax=Streptomyces xinghaiensis TaxID=1038928 RepID=A0A3M8F7B8_9ACTN|nr:MULTISPECIES: DUF4254 domain-containing protein [Streptomyces]PQM23960.1 DUF4254 domain-containing protein [Streptomyces xinghaiensis]RKM91931.1 DUF4254 domain-containing protein [Streptomyces xinghaiensis]RNC73652.1 DUF4254 domain-containing protein [Streptomyces xinghaiensis]